MAYTTATLTGTYKTFDNLPASGVVEIIPNSRSLVDAEGNVILAGRVKVTLDDTGSFTVTLPATDDPTVEPATGRQYTVVAKLRHTHLPAVTGVELAAGATVDVADVAVAPPTDALVTPAASEAQLAALQAEVDAHEANVTNPHGVTKAQVGLGNVDNVSASSLRDRSTHTGTQPAASITGLAPVATSGSKADVGLGNVDNTSDANKPISTATQAALNAKQDKTALDADMAAKVNDTASQTRAALSASYARVVTPEGFGATGDGTADDAAAFEAMFTSLAGARARVYLAPGKTYRLASTVDVTGLSGVTIDGYGATVKADPDTQYALFDVTDTDGLEVRGVYFNGGRVGAYRPYEYGNYGWRLRGSAVNVGFDGCRFSWFNDGCIKGEGEDAPGGPHPTAGVAKNLRITNCRFSDTYHVAMLGKYGTATGLVFANNFLTRVSGPVEIDGQALETAYTTGSGNAVIANNVWTDCTGNPSVEGALIFIEEDAYDIVVTGNVFRRITDLAGLHLDDGQTHKNFGRITIANNNFEEFTLSSSTVTTANPYCILIRNQSTATGAALRDLTIQGNRFARTAGGAIYVSQAANADAMQNLRIIDNEFVDVGCWGTINAGGNDAIRLTFTGAFGIVKFSGNVLTRRTSQLKSSSWLRIDGDRTKSQGEVMVSDNLFESPTDNDPNTTYLNGLLRLVQTGNTMVRAQTRWDAVDGVFMNNRTRAAIFDIGVAITTACRATLIGNSFEKGGGGTDYAIRVKQSSVTDGSANFLLGYTGNPLFLSAGTYKGTYQRELGAVTTV